MFKLIEKATMEMINLPLIWINVTKSLNLWKSLFFVPLLNKIKWMKHSYSSTKGQQRIWMKNQEEVCLVQTGKEAITS